MKKFLITILFAAVSLTSMAESKVKNAVKVGTAEGTKIAKAKLTADMSLHLTAAYKGYTIKSFEFHCLPKDGSVQESMMVQGSSFAGKEFETVTKNLKTGDRLYFENITLVAADGTVVQTNAAVEVQ